MNEMKAEV